MKKFTKIIICLLLCVFSFSFVACDKRTDQEKGFGMPASTDHIYGNDGLAVRKGNYLYYVNGYKTVNSEEHTQEGSYTHGALMVAKLDKNGDLVTDEKGLLDDDYYISLSSRLCGFEATNLYLAGDYLYFATPSKENKGGDKAGTDPEWAKDYVEFYRIKLDKSSKAEKIYQAGVTYEHLEFEYYEANNDVYIVTYEKGAAIDTESSNKNALVKVAVSSKESSVIANNISELKFGDEICYTIQNSSNKNYYLYSVNVGSEPVEMLSSASSITINDVDAGKVYVTVTENSTKTLKSAVLGSQNFADLLYISESGYGDILIDNNIVMLVKDKTISFVDEEQMISSTLFIKDEDASKINVIGIDNGSIVYYVDGSSDGEKIIKTVSHTNLKSNGSTEIKTIATVKDFDTEYLDLDDGLLYYFKKVNSHTYLHRIDTTNVATEEEMVGVYLEADIPEEPADETPEE